VARLSLGNGCDNFAIEKPTICFAKIRTTKTKIKFKVGNCFTTYKNKVKLANLKFYLFKYAEYGFYI
jgi:hypothetical protein